MEVFIGKSSRNGSFSMAMLNNQRVDNDDTQGLPTVPVGELFHLVIAWGTTFCIQNMCVCTYPHNSLAYTQLSPSMVLDFQGFPVLHGVPIKDQEST